MSRVKSREYAFRLVFEKFFHDPLDDLMFEFDDIVIDDEDKIFVNQLIKEINTLSLSEHLFFNHFILRRCSIDYIN